MNFARHIALASCVLVLGAGAALAGINSKEVGALLVYPEYFADEDRQTYITITNNKSSAVNAHVGLVGGRFCSDCNFDLPMTGFQTRRLHLRADGIGGAMVEDASVSSDPNAPDPGIMTACPEPFGFVVVTLEAARDALGNPAEPRVTLGENMLHGDEVVVDVPGGDAVQVGAIAVQGVGPNDGDRVFRFDNLEYAAFPSILTADFWAQNSVVRTGLILFNLNFTTGRSPLTTCSVNFVDAEEHKFSRNLDFRCWSSTRLSNVAAGSVESVLGTGNGYLWAQCDAGTHGALWTFLSPNAGSKYPHTGGEFKDTLFQSVTTNPGAVLRLTPDVTGTP